jgi:FMN phosphatase YigB (HAD superfamily)
VAYGKPNVPVFRYAEIALLRLVEMLELEFNKQEFQSTEFENIYMIGDNPATDILGARQVGMTIYYWETLDYFSIYNTIAFHQTGYQFIILCEPCICHSSFYYIRLIQGDVFGLQLS